jgi:2'-5' RNA ligase
VFFALWPQPALQAALADVTRDVVLASGGRPVPFENFHVTLVFVGSVRESSVAKLKAIGEQVAAAAGRAPVQVTLDAVEYWKKAKVVCATAGVAERDAVGARQLESAGNRRAEELGGVLGSHLTSAGFTPDLKPFRAHVTLARKVSRGSRDWALQSVLWSFTEFSLVESRTQAQGAVYRVLESFSLVRR